MVENIQIPKGYKHTEIGIIPEDWEVYSFGDLFSFLTTATNSRADLQENGNIAYIHYGDIHTKWDIRINFAIADKPFISNKLCHSAFIEEGDLIVVDVSEDQEGVGKSVEVINLGTKLAISGLHTYLLRPKNNLIINGYKGYIQKIHSVKQQIGKFATGLKVYSISKANLKEIKFPLPSQIEQEAIAKVFFDIDKLIENSEKLIDKKRDIKLATMQQLLTGKTRLPGFNDTWGRKTLGEIGKFFKGSGIRRDDIIPQGLKCIRYGEIYTRYNNFTKTLISHISHAISKTATPISKGDLLFAGSGETSEEIGKCVAYIGNEDAFAGGDIVILHQTINDPIYLGYLLNQKEVADQKANFGQGDAVVHINATNLAKVEVNLPPKEEQTAIVNLLSDMDSEIEELEKQLAKIKALKQGMMQELLTGRIRLIQSESKQKTKSAGSQTDKKHNWAINEAVIVSTLVNKFGSEQFPLGRKRYTKMSYLFHRFIDGNTEGYVKMAAGPYNPKTKYGGVETIAHKNGYIKDHQNGLLTGFIGADNNQQALDYFDKWYGSEALQWLEQFRYEKNDTLELWATVDMAIQDLRETQKNINVENIKGIIRSNKEWKAKLTRPIFSDDNIAEAIIKTQQLFTEGQT